MIDPDSRPLSLREREREQEHEPPTDRLGAVELGLAELKGRVGVILIIDAGTFLAVGGLLLAKAF